MIRCWNCQPTNSISEFNLKSVVTLDYLTILQPKDVRVWITLHNAFKSSCLSTDHGNVLEWLERYIERKHQKRGSVKNFQWLLRNLQWWTLVDALVAFASVDWQSMAYLFQNDHNYSKNSLKRFKDETWETRYIGKVE